MDLFFTIIIVFAAMFFIYNKFRLWRASDELVKRVYQSKSTLSLGVFLVAFGLNLLIMPRSTVDIVIGVIFFVLGIANAVFGYRAYRHYDLQLDE